MKIKLALTEEQEREIINSIEVLENEEMWVMRIIDEHSKKMKVKEEGTD
jgi:hypothetical protein